MNVKKNYSEKEHYNNETNNLLRGWGPFCWMCSCRSWTVGCAKYLKDVLCKVCYLLQSISPWNSEETTSFGRPVWLLQKLSPTACMCTLRNIAGRTRSKVGYSNYVYTCVYPCIRRMWLLQYFKERCFRPANTFCGKALHSSLSNMFDLTA